MNDIYNGRPVESRIWSIERRYCQWPWTTDRASAACTNNKCIEDDTKAAARQGLNCIKNKKNKYGEKRFSIWRMEFLHPAKWHVALESWQWIHQVAAPCNVISGSGMTCHWIRPNVRHTGIIHLVSISTHHRSRHVILYKSAKFYRNRTTLGRKKWRHVYFQDGGSQPSWIVGIQ